MKVCFWCCETDPDIPDILDGTEMADWLRLACEISKRRRRGGGGVIIWSKTPDFLFWFFNCLSSEWGHKYRVLRSLGCSLYAVMDEQTMKRYQETYGKSSFVTPILHS